MRFSEFKNVTSEGILDWFKSTPAEGPLTVPRGAMNAETADIQKVLIELGYKLPIYGVDGIRGPETRAAIKKFQTDNGLKVDGIPGPETVSKLNQLIKGNGIKFEKSTSSDVKPASGQSTDVDTSTLQGADFDTKLKSVADKLGVDSNNLRKIIKFETAGTFSPTSHDPWNVSIGLIGFTERTARGLGTSKEELANMTAVQQLDYVYKFYKKNGLRPGSDVGTMYMLTFMPAYAYAPDNTVLGQKGGGTLGHTGLSMHKIWLQNPGFGKSRGKDFFTVGDVKNLISSRR